MDYDLDEQFNSERKVFADLEYTEPVAFVEEEDDLELDEEEKMCSCDIDPIFCELHTD